MTVVRGDERWHVGDPHLDQRLSEDMGLPVRQDGAEPGERWLQSLAQERDLCLAVYADVIRPGRVTLGDRVRTV